MFAQESVMDIQKDFAKFLKENQGASVSVFEGDLTKSIVFDGAIVVQLPELTFVRIGNVVYETESCFYDMVFKAITPVH